MSTGHFILLLESDPSPVGPLATQLVRLGIEPIRVSNLDEAVDVLKSGQYVLGGILLPSHLPGKDVRKAMKKMHRYEPMLACMVYGKAPERAQRKLLRQAGALLSLWDGYDIGILRFQINRLLAGENQPSVRSSRRAPIHSPVRVEVGGREKDGFLYSLSEGGCFIETPRASMDGARIRLFFTLEEHALEIDGVVAFANVPGNLKRPNLPLGMAVRFESLEGATSKQLRSYVKRRLAGLSV